jgi:dTDP-4-dehydrorhamnose 3,5-epimerase
MDQITMEFSATSISGAFEIQLSPREDERGIFTRLYCQKEFKFTGHTKNIVQVNHSVNRLKGTIRGLHFQYAPFSETKIIRCIRGRVFDVVVDLRKDSESFLKWQSVELSPDKYNAFCIPEGCAHGFQTLEPDSEMLYFHTEFFHPEAEGALRFDDPLLGIQWPLPPVNVSEKDKNYPLLDADFTGISI